MAANHVGAVVGEAAGVFVGGGLKEEGGRVNGPQQTAMMPPK
jgi:hypothetical protein